MKRTKLILVMAIAAAFAGNAEAVYKCTTAKGVVYQDRPCVEGAQSDVNIVVPTGEIAPKLQASKDDAVQSDPVRNESRAAAAKTERTAGDSPNLYRRDARTRNEAGATGTRSSNANGSAAEARGATAANGAGSNNAVRGDGNETRAGSDVPMTPEQARNTEPTAKYYTTDGAAPGNETPSRMTCESPSGEKRIFILTNGKLTSI